MLTKVYLIEYISLHCGKLQRGECMRILFAAVFIWAAWRWSDWKNWKDYYPTYLFLTALSFISDFLMYNHSLWFYCPSPNFPNHTAVALFYAFTIYPATVLLFLSCYPVGSYLRQAAYIALWVCVYSLMEAASLVVGIGSYYNDWTLWWSVLVNIVLFIALRVHFSNPLLAWLLGALFSALILNVFDFRLTDFK